MLALLLLKLTDLLSMGLVAEWLDRNFSYESTYVDADGKAYITHRFNWAALKQYFVTAAVLFTVAAAPVCLALHSFLQRRRTRQTVRRIANYLEHYALTDAPFPADVPEEYAELFLKISEIRRSREADIQSLLAETQRKNELVAYLAHDLKTPLTSVIGYLSLLQDEDDLPPAQRSRFTKTALRKAERLETLIAELFEITRFDLSHIELQTETVDLTRMLQQIVSEFGPLLREKHLRICADLAPEVQICCDTDKLERILDNLLRNAVSYSYPDTVITVTLRETAETVCLTVCNRGKTIPPAQLQRLFEQFFRADAARGSRTGGAGLGLAIARQLAEAHGGILKAESRDEQITLTLRLPVKCQNIV